MNDLRFALRQLLKKPGLTAVAVVTLSLGIMINLYSALVGTKVSIVSRKVQTTRSPLRGIAIDIGPPPIPRTWQYKTWISHDGATRHMVTIAPVGGATGTTPRI